MSDTVSSTQDRSAEDVVVTMPFEEDMPRAEDPEDASLHLMSESPGEQDGTRLRGCSHAAYSDADGNQKKVSLRISKKLSKVELSQGVCCKCGPFAVSEVLGCGLSCLIAIVILIAILCSTLIERQRTVRTYFIGIDDVFWDYTAGSPINNCTGQPYAYPDGKYISGGSARIGSTYAKAQFRAYTDETFQTLKPRPAEWAHLGLLGPAIHAEVGDIVEVVVRNNARFPFSFATHGVGANKANEGVSYRSEPGAAAANGFDDALPPLSLGVRDCGTPVTFLSSVLPTTSDNTGRVQPGNVHTDQGALNKQDLCSNHAVQPSESRTYTFLVDAAAGPGPGDGSSVMHLYTSHVGGHSMTTREGGADGFAADSNAGLVGPLIITRKGSANPSDGRPIDIDRELVVVMGVQDENDSPYLRQNIWDRLVKPVLDRERPSGYVPFGPTAKERALMALYLHATRGVDKLSFSEAQALIAEANAAHTYVGSVKGKEIHVHFGEAHFNPRWYDAANGGYGSALRVLEELWIEAVDVSDPGFVESNAMHTVNGYLLCTQPGLDMVSGEKVRWYTASVGGVDAIHTPHWHGNTVVYQGGRGDQFELLASSTAVADMTPENPGIWQLHCHVNDHKKAGMLSLYKVETALGSSAPSETCADLSSGTERTYYIQAEAVEWDYYPPADAASGVDLCSGGTLSFAEQPATWTKFAQRALEANGEDRIGTSFTKAQYVEYTDATFTTKKAQPSWAGILGPTLRGAVGDSIKVVAKNALPFPISFHPHGVRYQKGAEGAPYNDGTSGADTSDDSLATGATHEYVWCIPESAGPGPSDGSSIVWLYHDHVNEVNGTNGGLVGPIIVTRADSADTNAAPSDVDSEFVLLFAAFNENAALHTEHNIATRLPNFVGNNASLPNAEQLTYEMRKYDRLFQDSMRKRHINGKLQCALSGLEWSVGDTVRFHLISVGDEELHAPLLSGQSFSYHSQRTSGVGLMASSMKTVDFEATAGGSLLLTTGSESGALRGMVALANVSGTPPAAPAAARTYYIAADEVQWDFMPSGANQCGDEGQSAGGSRAHSDTLHAESNRAAGIIAPAVGYNSWEDNGLESEFSLYTNAHASPHRIGTQYVMALFREYTDETFTSLSHGFKSRANAASSHLGMQGPVLRALPGEAVSIVLHNRLRHACNFVIGGMRAAGGAADERPLLPGETRTVTYIVDVSNGPLGGLQASAAFKYSSDYRAALAGLAAYNAANPGTPMAPFAEFADSNAGLYGALIVTHGDSNPREDLAPGDVSREFVLFMGVLDQNKSPYLGMNIAQFAAAPEYVDRSDPDFKESNRMHAINGRIYCNLEGLSIMSGRSARWYVFSHGGDDAFAAPRWYGTSALVDGSYRMASALVQPGTSVAADVTHDNYGTWLLQDQTFDHAYAGASALFRVNRKIAALCELAFWMKC